MTSKERGRRSDGEATRKRILAAALKLFRKRGFERTTMRDIASEASLSLGAAYHYFPSKDAIVFDYYVARERELGEQIEAPLSAAKDTRERLGIIIHGKLDQVRGERQLIGGLFRVATDPESPLSVFAEETSSIRLSSVARFADALRDEPLPVELRVVAAEGLWVVHLGLLLFFMHDRSAGQARTRALVDHAIDLLVDLIRVIAAPGADALRDRIARILFDIVATGASAVTPPAPERAHASGRRLAETRADSPERKRPEGAPKPRKKPRRSTL